VGEEAGRDDDCGGEDRAGVFFGLRFWFEGFGQGRWSLTFKIDGALDRRRLPLPGKGGNRREIPCYVRASLRRRAPPSCVMKTVTAAGKGRVRGDLRFGPEVEIRRKS